MSARNVVFTLTARLDPNLRSIVNQFSSTMASAHIAVDTASAKTTMAMAESAQSQTSKLKQETQVQVSTAKNALTSIDDARVKLDSVEQQRRERALARFRALEDEKVRISIAADQAIEAAINTAHQAGIDFSPEEEARIEVDIRLQAAREIAEIDKKLADDRKREFDRIAKYEEDRAKKAIADEKKVNDEKRRYALRREEWLEREAKKDADKAAAQERRDAEREAKEKKRDAEKADREAKREAAATERESKKNGAQFERDVRAAESAAQRQAAATRNAYKRAGEDVERFKKAANAAIHDSISAVSELGESVMRVVRGFTAIGLVGEKDLDKIKDKLLAVQGAFDLVSGGMQVFNKITRSVDQLKRVIELTTSAHKSLNEVMAAGAALSSSAGYLAAGGAAGGAKKMTTAAANSASNLMLGAGTTAAASAAGGAAHHVIQSGSAASAMPTMVTLSAAVAAVGGALYGLVGSIDSARNFLRNATLRNGGLDGFEKAQAGSFADRMGGRWNPFSQVIYQGEWNRVADTEKALTKQAAGNAQRAMAQKALAEKSTESFGTAAGLMAQSMSSRNSMFDQRTDSLSSAEKIKAITKEIAAEQVRINRLKVEAAALDERFGSAQSEYQQLVEHGEQRVLSLIQRRHEAEKAIARDKVTAAREALSNVERELQATRSISEAAQQKIMSAKERFGLLGDEEQKDLLSLARRANRGEKLTPDELRKLQGIGSDRLDATVRKQAMARADAAGFGEISRDDQRELQKLRSMEKQLEIKVKDARQFVVKLEANEQKIVDGIAKQVLAKTMEFDRAVAVKLEQAMREVNDLKQRVMNVSGGR